MISFSFLLILVMDMEQNYKYNTTQTIKQQKMDNQQKASRKSQKSKNSKSLNKSRKNNSSGFKRSQYRNGDTATSINTIKKVLDFLSHTAESERKLEIIKQTLAEQQNFTPASLFYRLNAERKKQISEKDIEDFLIQSNIQFKGSQLKTLFGRIDVNQSQSISLRQFQDFILPNQNPKLRYETVRRPVLIPKPHQKLSKEIEYFTIRFFKQIIKQYSELADINSTLKSSYDFNSQNIFQLLGTESGTITGDSLRNFVQNNGGSLETEQIGCLIKIMDRQGIAKVNQEDFDNFLATMGLKKTHQVFDELSPIPALKNLVDYSSKDRRDKQIGLKQRYKDNKSYVKGMDQQAHHIPGYSKVLDQNNSNVYKSRLQQYI